MARDFDEAVQIGLDWLLVRGYDSEDGIEIERAWTEDGVPLHAVPEQFLDPGLWHDIEQALLEKWRTMYGISEWTHHTMYNRISKLIV